MKIEQVEKMRGQMKCSVNSQAQIAGAMPGRLVLLVLALVVSACSEPRPHRLLARPLDCGESHVEFTADEMVTTTRKGDIYRSKYRLVEENSESSARYALRLDLDSPDAVTSITGGGGHKQLFVAPQGGAGETIDTDTGFQMICTYTHPGLF